MTGQTRRSSMFFAMCATVLAAVVIPAGAGGALTDPPGPVGRVSVGAGALEPTAPSDGVHAATTDPTGEFTPLTPVRILDTRTTTGGHQGALGPGETFALQVTGVG